ncbi:hypothetical protein AVEN_273407-1 [Araneus ventricosus]|uniref:Mos1 transposase HTH domain-containing protein n=1 Tax=Araneus ventricosus TaxID=182803 RepID=A0A4Y2E1K8_ARAVE|nr:hypothetical protein AVEN_273407-1 [Araneus ventricosus]
MEALAETGSEIEVRSVIRFFNLKKTDPAEIHRQLVKVYGASVISRKQVWFWHTELDKTKKDVRNERNQGGQAYSPHMGVTGTSSLKPVPRTK